MDPPSRRMSRAQAVMPTTMIVLLLLPIIMLMLLMIAMTIDIGTGIDGTTSFHER